MALSLPHTLQALLFASGEALPKKRVLSLLEIPEEMLEAAVTELQDELQGTGLSLVITDNEFELRTSPDASLVVEKLRQSELSRDLGKAGLETLAIVLYQNGATRGEVDFVRGVNSTAALRSLLLRGLVERSADESDKRRARYTVTIDALAHLGISKREDLPGFSELSGTLGAHHAAAEVSSEVA
ncbi:MAG: SMC-Scp complex subunit ScpB [Candidatus Paceibacterota bacterium]